VFAVEDISDDVVLRDHFRRLGGRAMTFQRCYDFERFFVLAFADQEAGRVGEKRTQGVDAEGKEELKGKREAPCDVAGCEGKGECEPVGDTEASDAICW
jgi:hypothetical protein